MSTAGVVPETWELTGDDAKETLARTDRTQLVKDAITRLRYSDGFSHARSMAFLLTLVFVQPSSRPWGSRAPSGAVAQPDDRRRPPDDRPGPAGRVLTTAVDQAHRAGSDGQWIAIAVGTIGALITGTTLIGQIERSSTACTASRRTATRSTSTDRRSCSRSRPA